MTAKPKFSGYSQAFLAALITFTIGMSYGAYSMLILPLAERLNISTAAAGIPGTVETFAAFGLGLLGAGTLIKKWTARRCILIGALVASAFCGAYLYLPTLFLVGVYEAVVGFTQSFGYSVGMAAFIRQWFIEKREMVLGVATAAIGFGSAAGTFLYGVIETNMGTGAVAIGFGCLGVLCLIIYLFFLRTPDQLGQKPLGWEKAEALAAAEGKAGGVDFGIEFKDALKSPSLYLIMGSCLLWALAMVTTPYLATILMTNGMDTMGAANYSSISNLAVAGMALLLGTLTSKLGPKSYVVTAFGAGILGLVTLQMWTATQSSAILFIASILMGGGYVVGNTYAPMVTTKVFGNKAYDQIIPLVFGMRCVGLGVGVLLLPGIADKTGSWTLSLYLAMGMMVVAIFIGLLALKLAPMNKLHAAKD